MPSLTMTRSHGPTTRLFGGSPLNSPTNLFILTSTCCAFAGDRGLLHEELTRSATHDEAREVMHQDLDLYICANRTCEVGMEDATRAPYQSFVYALAKLTRTWLLPRCTRWRVGAAVQP